MSFILNRLGICSSLLRFDAAKPKPISRLWAMAAPILLLLAVPAARAADWPQFLGPSRNGISTETGLLQSWTAQGPPTLWEHEIGAGYSGPVVNGGGLILFHRIAAEEVIERQDAATGKVVWRTAYASGYVDDYGKGDGPRSTPLIAEKRVFTLGPEGQLDCLDFDTGRILWKRALHEDYPVPKNFCRHIQEIIFVFHIKTA